MPWAVARTTIAGMTSSGSGTVDYEAEGLSGQDALYLGIVLGVDWEHADLDTDEFPRGIEFELARPHPCPGCPMDEDEDVLAAFRAALASLPERPEPDLRA